MRAAHQAAVCRRLCPSGGVLSPLLPNGRSHARGREDGQAHKNAGPLVRDPAQVFRLD
jgi:hypothetical protein